MDDPAAVHMNDNGSPLCRARSLALRSKWERVSCVDCRREAIRQENTWERRNRAE